MYSEETLKKFVNKARTIETELTARNISDIKMTISSGNRKIGKVLNVSLPPILTCANCKECKHLCYDVKACMQYPLCIESRIRNLVILKKDRERFFAEIDKKCTNRRKNKFFRWHVAGDIIDYDYFSRMVEIARNHSDFVFWTYTKNYKVVNDYVANNGGDRFVAIPSNLAIMFSEWRGMELVNPYNFPIFTVCFKDENETDFKREHKVSYKCPGNCDICKACKRGCTVGESSYTLEH